MGKGCRDKRGLSHVVSAVLLILLLIVLVGIFWMVVRNVLKTQSEDIFLGKVTVNLNIEKVKKINDTHINLTIKREAGKGEIEGVYFVAYDKNSSEIVKYHISMKELEEKNFEIVLYVINASEVEKIAVAPIFKLESGKEVVGDIKDEASLKTGSSSSQYENPPECTTDTNCDDENPCTENKCSNEKCVFIPMDCDDGEDCTEDMCVNGKCIHTMLECNDNNLCTVDSCSDGSCVYTPKDCNDNDGCTTDSCNTLTGLCVHTEKSCNDNDECTVDLCSNGVCSYIPVGCIDNDGCCTAGCNIGNDNDCTICTANSQCEDSNKCTVDLCSNGVCTHPALNCNDNNKCTTDSCNSATGCVYTSKNCNDNNKCTTDSCNSATGCVYTSKNCNDNDECTTDSCNTLTGLCVHTEKSCNDNDLCTIDYCSNGICRHDSINCNDNDKCTEDLCSNGVCIHPALNCNDNNGCTTDSCNTLTGLCVHTPVNCNDNDKCTVDLCSNGICSYIPVGCIDNDGCCTAGCNIGNDNDCTVCTANSQCEDSNKCTVDLCSNGVCTHPALNCDDGNGCTTDSCNALIGCVHTPKDCDDNNKCTTDLCSNGVCTNAEIICNDNNACTTNSCNPLIGCVFNPITCNDNNKCTTDSCNSATGCVYSAINCDDNNKCTTDSCNSATGCLHTNINCDDNDPCTTDSCNPSSGCVHISDQCGETNYLRTFYISSSSGSDSNNGLSPSTPWKTIAKVNSQTFLPGDGILFKRGDTWTGETLVPLSSGNSTHRITYSAYGTGDKPIISGFTTVTGWTNEGGGIYSKTVSTQSSPEVVLVNGKQYTIGRWPNEEEWRHFESHVSNISITDNELSSSPDWTGAEVVIRVNEWSILRNLITDHTGQTITYSATVRNRDGPYDNWGYFIQNDLRTLDKFGEWYYNNATKRFYMYFGSSNPNNYNVQVSNIDELISFRNYREKDYITFEEISLIGANKVAINIRDYNEYAIIKDCDIKFIGNFGIQIPWSHNCAILNTIIDHSNDKGIHSNSRNLSVKGCTISNTGTLTGMGLTSTQSHIGIYTGQGHEDIIENNKIYNSGYSGINFAGDNSIVRNNLIDTYCFNEVDGGGIYFGSQTFTSNMTIERNIVLNGMGAVGGKPIGTPLSAANGIYIDYNTQNGVQIYNNTVEHCVGGGIFIHESPNIEVMDNTVYNCTQAIRMQDSGLGTGMYNLIIKRNIFFAKYTSQLALWAYSKSVGFDQWGNFDYNYYARPIDEDKTFSASVVVWGGNLMSLNKWNELYNQDSHSHISPKTIPYYTVNGYLSSNKFYNGNFNTNISGGIGCWNGLGNCVLSWDNTKLDGGALKISFNSTVPPADSIISIPIGTVTAGKDYILKYSIIANKETNFDMISYLRKLYSPWTHLTNEYPKPITAVRTENEILLSATVSDSVSAILFNIDDLDSANNQIWIDNIELYEADVTITDPDDYLRFEYNPTNSNKVVTLPSGNYIDVAGKSYSGSVTLKPYSSVVLIKN